jgi:hypothetical protein
MHLDLNLADVKHLALSVFVRAVAGIDSRRRDRPDIKIATVALETAKWVPRRSVLAPS